MKRKVVYALITGVLSASMIFPSAVYACTENTDLTALTSSGMKISSDDNLNQAAGDVTKNNSDNNNMESVPSMTPEAEPTVTPEAEPTVAPEAEPTVAPEAEPTVAPEAEPTVAPEAEPTVTPEAEPTVTPEAEPAVTPEAEPAVVPENTPAVIDEKERVLAKEGRWLIGSTGQWWYQYKDGSYASHGWKLISGRWYYFDENGWMLTGWLLVDGNWYYTDQSGALLTGWILADGKWYYSDPSGAMKKDWQYIDGKWYFFFGDGSMAADRWVSGYYLGRDGAWKKEVDHMWIKADNNKWWYRHSDGSYTSSGWEKIYGNWYYFDEYGWMKTGWVLVSGKWYYLDPSGAMVTGSHDVDGKRYFFAPDGAMICGWRQQGNTWYYYDASGAMKTDWDFINGKWYYFMPSGEMIVGVSSIKGKTYFFAGSGEMLTGWQYGDGKWYYLSGDGSAYTGWNYINGRWYYFYADGIMAVGMLKEEGRQYYLDESGAMVTGWLKLKDDWYFFDGSGAMAVGWKSVNGQDYYFYADGTMAASTWVGNYYVREDGAYVPGKFPASNRGWHQFGSRWGYIDNDGKWLTSQQVQIDGRDYYFDEEGWMVTGWLNRGPYWNYFHGDGSKAYDEWIGNRGIGGYYINKYGKMIADDTYSLSNVLYTFDSNGKCIDAIERYMYVTDQNGRRYKVEHQYATDPHVGDVVNGHRITEDEYLSAAVFTEAGILGKTGMTAVALVMFNRMYDSGKAYPSQADIMLYDAMQFEVARNGTMRKWLYNIESPTLDGAKEAVREARKIMNEYLEKKTPRTVEGIAMPEGKKDFNYWGFMTINAFNNIGLDYERTEACTYKNTVFYTRWIKK